MQENNQIATFNQLEQLPLVELLKEKSEFERYVYALPQKEHTVSLDGLLHTLRLSENDERILIHNIADIAKTLIANRADYSVTQFLQDVDSQAANEMPEFRYSKVMQNCIELSGLVLDESILTTVYPLLTHFAACQNYFLLELVNMEICNGVTYGTSITKDDVFTQEQLTAFIANIQPYNDNAVQINYTDIQNQFMSLFVLNGVLKVIEGVLRAEKELEKQFGFQFNQ